MGTRSSIARVFFASSSNSSRRRSLIIRLSLGYKNEGCRPAAANVFDVSLFRGFLFLLLFRHLAGKFVHLLHHRSNPAPPDLASRLHSFLHHGGLLMLEFLAYWRIVENQNSIEIFFRQMLLIDRYHRIHHLVHRHVLEQVLGEFIDLGKLGRRSVRYFMLEALFGPELGLLGHAVKILSQLRFDSQHVEELHHFLFGGS